MVETIKQELCVSFIILLILLSEACNFSRRVPNGPTPVSATVSSTESPVEVATPSQTVSSNQPQIPPATGPCPEFKNGFVPFSPAGISFRWVYLQIGGRGGGPVVFWWHGLGGKAENVLVGLGQVIISEIVAQGGVVISIESDLSAIGEWFLNTTDQQDDLLVADLVVACAVKEMQIDISHIHVAGFSAGGKQAAQMAIRRSNYVASVVLYSGGLFPNQLDPYPLYQDPGNKLPSMVFWGGPSDVVVANNELAALDYYNFVSRKGNFVLMCNHNGGHTIPPEGPQAAWRFFEDHPWGVSPEPYDKEKPPEIPDYCTENP
jgi:predicted esterase